MDLASFQTGGLPFSFVWPKSKGPSGDAFPTAQICFCLTRKSASWHNIKPECFGPRDASKILSWQGASVIPVVAGRRVVRPIAEARGCVGRVALRLTPKPRRGNTQETALVKEKLSSLGGIRCWVRCAPVAPEVMRAGQRWLWFSRLSCSASKALGFLKS